MTVEKKDWGWKWLRGCGKPQICTKSSFCELKDIHDQVSDKKTFRWEKIFAKHISDKGLISKTSDDPRWWQSRWKLH